MKQKFEKLTSFTKQECIPVGCVPAARIPYSGVSFGGGGVSAPERVSALGGCLLWGGGGGVSAPEGGSAPEGRWYPSMH